MFIPRRAVANRTLTVIGPRQKRVPLVVGSLRNEAIPFERPKISGNETQKPWPILSGWSLEIAGSGCTGLLYYYHISLYLSVYLRHASGFTFLQQLFGTVEVLGTGEVKMGVVSSEHPNLGEDVCQGPGTGTETRVPAS